MNTKTLLTVCFLSLFAGACATGPEVLPGGEIIVDRSHEERPDWLNQRFIEKADEYYVIGNTRSRELGLGEDGAKLNAMVNLAGFYLATLNSIIGHGKNEIPDETARYLKSTADLAAKNVPVAGAITKEIYWEKIEKSSYGEVQYHYDVWALVRLTPEGYQRGLRYTLDKIKADATAGQSTIEKIKAYEERVRGKSN